MASRRLVGALAAVSGLALLLFRRRLRSHSSLVALLRSGRKAVCVGKNYREHITELAQMGPEWTLEEDPEPVLFLKPTTSYAWPGSPLVLPARRSTSLGIATVHGVHHELELGVIIGRAAKGVADEAEASACVAGYVLGLDITERDEQTAAKNAGMPWSVSKGYDSFLPLSAPFELAPGEDWRRLRLWLDVNGERRQACECGAMIHSVEKLICYISSIMTLEPGDLLLTGTPKGVGRLAAGDRVTAGVAGKVELRVDVRAERIAPARVAIRAYVPDDAAALQLAADQPEVARRLRPGFPSPYTLESARGWIGFATSPPMLRRAWAITVDGVVCGGVSVMACEAEAPRTRPPLPSLDLRSISARPRLDLPSISSGEAGLLSEADAARTEEVGYWVTPALWGRGVASRALALLLAAARGGGQAESGVRLEPGTTRLVAFAAVDNAASCRVLAKNGFAPTEGASTVQVTTQSGPVASRAHFVSL